MKVQPMRQICSELCYQFCVFLLPVTLCMGCIPAATAPIPTLEYLQESGTQGENLLILIRGIGGSNKSFEAYGLIEEIRRRQLPFDIVAPDAHFGYYKAENVEDRLNEDIILPARMQGYQRIWLAGFSMGGLGSLFYLREYAEQVDGVMLICPFVGWSGIINEIEESGGISDWSATTEDESDWQRLIWSWVKHYSTKPDEYPPIYLGYGDDDFLAGDGPALLAQSLPADRTFVVAGGHNYSTFRKIFLTHLDNLDDEFNTTGKASSKRTEYQANYRNGQIRHRLLKKENSYFSNPCELSIKCSRQG